MLVYPAKFFIVFIGMFPNTLAFFAERSLIIPKSSVFNIWKKMFAKQSFLDLFKCLSTFDGFMVIILK